MNTMNLLKSAAGAVALVSTGGSAAFAGTMPWSNASGAADTFTYADGCNATGLFGDPMVSADGNFFLFFPAGFSASASGGEGASADSAADRLQAVITAAPGREIKSVSASVVGDFSTLRGGAVDATALLSVTPPVGPALVAPVEFANLPAAAGASIFSGGAFIGLPTGVQTALVALDASLLAAADFGGSGFIQFKGANLSVVTAPVDTAPPATVPLPAAAFAMPIAGAIAFAAGRKRRR